MSVRGACIALVGAIAGCQPLAAAPVAHAEMVATELSPKNREDTIQGLLLYEYIAFVANSKCPGMKWNRPLILAARKVLGVTEEEITTGELARIMQRFDGYGALGAALV
jgi:hypothetical protein